MKNHLLSIFPMRGSNDDVRIYLTPLHDTATRFAAPFIITRKEVARRLESTSLENTILHQLRGLSSDDPIQVAISDDDALILAFARSEALHA